MGTWKQVLWWVLGVLLILLSVGAILVHLLTRDKATARLAVSSMEAAHRPFIREKEKRLDLLKQDYEANEEEIHRLMRELMSRYDDLHFTYSSAGLSAEEVATRLAQLQL